jgi:hypothetical protein
MAYQLKDGQGNLWKNKRKTKDNHPDVTGKVMLGGQLYYISGWRKVAQSGEGWYSLAFKAADEMAQVATNQEDEMPGF